ncbi:MAG: VWA domain-containing protein [Vicinamibacterales bacterium]
MRITRSFAASLAASAVLAMSPAGVHGQNPPQRAQAPVFKAKTALVEVDAVVLDKKGNFVSGLKPDDVTVLENGKPQQIQQFYMVTHSFGNAPGAPVSQYDAEADFHAHRVFVLLFDEGGLANDSMMRAKQGAEAFVHDQMGPEDAGGVYVNGAMFHGLLTADKSELYAGIRAVKPAFDNRQKLLAPFRDFPQIDSETDALRISDGSQEVKADMAADDCHKDPADCQYAGGIEQVTGAIQQKSDMYVRQARVMTNATLKSLETVAQGLGRLPGRKTVVFITEGFFTEEVRSSLERIAGEAARNGVTFYSIDARGMVNHMTANPDVLTQDPARSTLFDTGEDGPNMLTGITGGFMVRNIDDMSRAFGLIVRDTSTYYVIGYAPENATMDGKFRKIEVKTRVPNVKIRARTGYLAVDLPPQQSIWGPGQ